MLDESPENYFAPCTSKLNEHVKLTISRVINGDRIILSDFYKFWQNITTKQELFDYFISCMAQPETNVSIYQAILVLLSLNSKRLDDRCLKYIDTIFSKINDNDFMILKNISIQSACSMSKFFDLWLKHIDHNPILPIISMLLYPTLIHKSDPFLSLNQFVSESEYFGIILNYTLLFRTTSEENLKQTYDIFLKNSNDAYFFQHQQITSIILSELNIPYSNAALYNYNAIKCSNISHILFVPFQFYRSFLNIEVFSNVNKYQSTYSLIDNIYYKKFREENISPDPAFISEIYEKLIFTCQNAYVEFLNDEIDPNESTEKDNSELWEFFKAKSIPRKSEPSTFTPLMYPFDPVQLPNEILISFSSIKINGIPLLSGSTQNPFDKLKQGTKSNLYAIVIGSAIEMMQVLIDFVSILFEPKKNLIKKNLFILPILNEESRLSKFLNENDVFIRNNCNELIKLMFHIFPDISNKVVDSKMPFLEPDGITSFPNDFWRDYISPFSIFHRFFSFYCGCSAHLTKFAVWVAFLTNRKHQVYAVPFIDSVILKQCSLNGSINFNLSSPDGEINKNQSENYKFNIIPTDIKIMNMCLPSENCFPCTPEDNALILDANNLINDSSLNGPLLVSSITIKSNSNEFFNLSIDSVNFSDIKCLKIERLTKDDEKVYLSIRHFLPLKNGFY